MTTEETRAAIVAEARLWLGTPYHHAARVRGSGVDCAMLLAEVYNAAGAIPPVAVGTYPPDWHLHRADERYMATVLDYATEIDTTPAPGDVALFRFGRCYSHGAIVVQWPLAIHAYKGDGVVYAECTKGVLGSRPRKFYSLFGEE